MKIKQPITLNLVKLYKGIVDFYYWNGIAVARQWPRDPRQPGTAKQKKTWGNLTGMYAELKLAPLWYHAQWKDAPLPHGRSTTDLKRKTLMRCLAAELVPKICKVVGIWKNPGAYPGQDLYLIYISPQPGKDMTGVEWKYRRYTHKKPPIVWQDWGLTMQRTHGIKIDYKPDVASWSLPLSQVYEPTFSRYAIVLPASPDKAAFINRMI